MPWSVGFINSKFGLEKAKVQWTGIIKWNSLCKRNRNIILNLSYDNVGNSISPQPSLENSLDTQKLLFVTLVFYANSFIWKFTKRKHCLTQMSTQWNSKYNAKHTIVIQRNSCLMMISDTFGRIYSRYLFSFWSDCSGRQGAKALFYIPVFCMQVCIGRVFYIHNGFVWHGAWGLVITRAPTLQRHCVAYMPLLRLLAPVLHVGDLYWQRAVRSLCATKSVFSGLVAFSLWNTDRRRGLSRGFVFGVDCLHFDLDGSGFNPQFMG